MKVEIVLENNEVKTFHNVRHICVEHTKNYV